MKISLLSSRTDTAPVVVETFWLDMVNRLGKSRVLPATANAYAKHDKKQQGELKDGPAWIPGELSGPRLDANMTALHFLVLDFDKLRRGDDSKLWLLLERINRTFYAHTSASHTPDKPKWRVVMPLDRPVEAGRWKEFWLGAVWWLGFRELNPDQAAKNPSRLYYLPSHLLDVWPEHRGRPVKELEVDDIRPAPPPPPRRAPALSWDATDDAIRHARNALRKIGPAIEGAGGDAQTFKACCYVLRDLGLSESQGLEVLREWNQTCSPPWSDAELEAKAKHALKYGKNEIGSRRYAGNSKTWDINAVRAYLGSNAK